MSRTAVYSALVLRSRPSGESNNEISLLTAEEGVIKATVFGGPKSKLRSHAAPYNSGQVWIYRDPAKDYGKLNDFDVHSWRPGLRELYERTMAASGVAETILCSHGGGGEWEAALKLAVSTLDALENANEELCERLLVHFLWRWAGFLGIQPHIESCAACGAVCGAASGDAEDAPLWFSPKEGSALCENCVPKSSSVPADQALSPKPSSVPAGFLRLNPGCRRWLAAVGPLEPSILHRYSMDSRSFREAKSLATAVLTWALGKRLASWDF
jgi:DNA repair protein RecO (recombination protein O)